ncbi:hypothetical protein MFIFM68171_01929 [Madurella fahalii]|uniref:Methyltransferase n=1 Tax=Madurella fahalii TaxID=1157608 RepID=A0ABQ0G1U8_9PEZI
MATKGDISVIEEAVKAKPPTAIEIDVDVEVDVDVDLVNDAGESVYESSYATSLASSVQNYPVEHGRRYHAFRAGRYSRPNDEQEMERLFLLHEIMTRVQGGLYSAPIDKERTKRILDIGTGTGVWAISIADEFPNATIIGNDLSANQPNFVPANVRFEVDDVEDAWVHPKEFSWIFCRYMAASILDWPNLVTNIYENLEPGGWCEFQDFDLQYYSDDGSLKPDDALLVWISTLLDAARALGRDPNPGSKLQGWVQKAGFVNVVHRRYKIPFGPWARDPLLKEIGAYNFMQVDNGLEGLSLRLFTSVLRWEEAEIKALLERVRADLRNPRIHAMFDFHVVYGQKPE